MKPHPEPLKTQHISRSLSVVTSIGHLTFYKHYHKQVQNSISSDEMLKHKTNNYCSIHVCKIKEAAYNTEHKICTPPGRILFNHMTPMAETPHTQNRNGSKVSRKVCSKRLSLHKQCHKHALEKMKRVIKVVYSRPTQKSSQSYNATQNT